MPCNTIYHAATIPGDACRRDPSHKGATQRVHPSRTIYRGTHQPSQSPYPHVGSSSPALGMRRDCSPFSHAPWGDRPPCHCRRQAPDRAGGGRSQNPRHGRSLVSGRATAPTLDTEWLEVREDRPFGTARRSRLGTVEARLRRLIARLSCPRCSTPPPPDPRWPGDRWARDTRPACMCGQSR